MLSTTISPGIFQKTVAWKVLEYAASLGEIHDIVVENMERQADGLKG